MTIFDEGYKPNDSIYGDFECELSAGVSLPGNEFPDPKRGGDAAGNWPAPPPDPYRPIRMVNW